MLELAEQGSYVVLAGEFNPAIFNPDWLARQGLITDAEAENSTVEQVSAQIAKFQIASLTFDVRQDKMMILAEMEPFVRLADLVGSLFVDKLRHTPLHALGINYYVHAVMADVQSRIRFGRLLAPTAPWGELGKTFDTEVLEDTGGMVDLTMQSKRREGYPGIVRTTIQPSVRVPNHRGVFFQVNDHFTEEEKLAPAPINRNERRLAAKAGKRDRNSGGIERAKPTVDYATLCVEEFTASIARSKMIVGHLMTAAEQA